MVSFQVCFETPAAVKKNEKKKKNLNSPKKKRFECLKV